MAWYRSGTVSLTNGSKNVTGDGTLFISNIKSGFALLAPDYSVYEIDNISSDTSFTLKENYRGSSVTGGSYGIWQTQGIIKDLTDEVTALINTFGAFRDAYESGELVGQGLELKGVLDNPSQLPSTGQVIGDAYLIGTSLYVWTGSGGWKSSNIAGIIPRGAWSAGTAYAVNDTVTYQGSQYRRKVAGTTSGTPVADTANWDLFVSIGQTGPAGVNARGAWSAGTAYAVNDLAGYSGSQWRRLVAGTTSTPPDMDSTNWVLFASKGLDGNGSVVSVNSQSPDINGNVLLTTSNISEGTSQYFTVQRAKDAVYPSPAFTGIPTAPTAAPGTNTTQLATTAFVRSTFGPAFSAYKSGVQSIPLNSATRLNFQTNEYDTDSLFTSTNRFTTNVGGYYQVQAGVGFDNVGSGQQLILYKNGSIYKFLDFSPNSGILSGGCEVYLNGTSDYIEIFCVSGAAANANANSSTTYFQCSMIRAA